MKDFQNKQEDCPYLSVSQLECKVTEGGLYLPMPEHIDMFCKDASHVHCRHYLRGCEICKENAQKMGLVNDESRRKYRRVRERIDLFLAQYSDSGKLIDVLDDSAYTIDLSLGGFRFESRNPVPANERIGFSFGNDFVTPSWQGFGQVRWTDSLKDSKGFQSGLTFTDSRTFQAVGRHMGLPGGLPMM